MVELRSYFSFFLFFLFLWSSSVGGGRILPLLYPPQVGVGWYHFYCSAGVGNKPYALEFWMATPKGTLKRALFPLSCQTLRWSYSSQCCSRLQVSLILKAPPREERWVGMRGAMSRASEELGLSEVWSGKLLSETHPSPGYQAKAMRVGTSWCRRCCCWCCFPFPGWNFHSS